MGDKYERMWYDGFAHGCLENPEYKIKDAADAITLSNEEDGVAAYLERWII